MARKSLSQRRSLTLNLDQIGVGQPLQPLPSVAAAASPSSSTTAATSRTPSKSQSPHPPTDARRGSPTTRTQTIHSWSRRDSPTSTTGPAASGGLTGRESLRHATASQLRSSMGRESPRGSAVGVAAMERASPSPRGSAAVAMGPSASDFARGGSRKWTVGAGRSLPPVAGFRQPSTGAGESRQASKGAGESRQASKGAGESRQASKSAGEGQQGAGEGRRRASELTPREGRYASKGAGEDRWRSADLTPMSPASSSSGGREQRRFAGSSARSTRVSTAPALSEIFTAVAAAVFSIEDPSEPPSPSQPDAEPAPWGGEADEGMDSAPSRAATKDRDGDEPAPKQDLNVRVKSKEEVDKEIEDFLFDNSTVMGLKHDFVERSARLPEEPTAARTEISEEAIMKKAVLMQMILDRGGAWTGASSSFELPPSAKAVETEDLQGKELVEALGPAHLEDKENPKKYGAAFSRVRDAVEKLRRVGFQTAAYRVDDDGPAGDKDGEQPPSL